MEKHTLTQPGYYSRIIDKRISECLQSFGAVSLEGPKWCGKTWTALNHCYSSAYLGHSISSSKQSDYDLALTDLDLVLSRDRPELVDEWQDIPAVWDTIRHKCDLENQPGLYILTGSATPPHIEDIHHSGAGRICRLNMTTMSLYESGDSSGDVSLADLFQNNVKPKELENRPTLDSLISYIIRGGWPAAISRKLATGALSEGYIEDVLKHDVIAIDGVKRDSEKMRLLIRSLARNESTIVSNKTLIRDLDEGGILNKNTVSDYLAVLEELHLLANQPAYRENVRSPERVGTSVKRHFTDPSLAVAALGLDQDGLLSNLKALGFLFEALCEHDLRVYIESLGGTLRHYRNNVSGLEIDAIVELKNGDIGAIEMKLSPDKIDEGVKSLNSFSSELTITPKFRAIICGLYSAITRRKEDGIYIFPLTALKN
ncbi:ATP-binding protein [Candidatus Saccharibacteria bacterium]|nr:ATP-binding protein [Candidatus Saccharibacteria bacterium]